MKRLSVQVPVYEEVQSGYRIVNKYIAEDGKEFYNETDCSAYEKDEKYKRFFANIIKKSDNSCLPNFINDNWFFPKDKDELESVLVHLHFYDTQYNTINCFGAFEPNEWIGGTYEDGGDYPSETNIFTLSYIKDEFQRFLSLLETKE